MLPPIVQDAISLNDRVDTSKMHRLLTRMLGDGSIPRSGKLLLQYIEEHVDEVEAFLKNPVEAEQAETLQQEQQVAEPENQASLYDMLPLPLNTSTRAVASIQAAEAVVAASNQAADAAVAAPIQAKASDQVAEALPVHEEEDTCSATLLSEATERLLAVVASSFKTDTGQVMLENDMAMLHEILLDMDPNAQYNNMLTWVQQMHKEWESRLHSSVFAEFKHALELWALATFHGQFA